ncbi:hypothetical protein [Roseateles sp. PN1]|uniref:hypothetical protein n=1 Tax=Roseateles sp. PN1 TaxID=3137372 RepID=UPI003139E0C5
MYEIASGMRQIVDGHETGRDLFGDEVVIASNKRRGKRLKAKKAMQPNVDPE